MARRNYKFTDKKHTRQGLMSMGMGAAALAGNRRIVNFLHRSRHFGFHQRKLFQLFHPVNTVRPLIQAVFKRANPHTVGGNGTQPGDDHFGEIRSYIHS